MYTDLPLSLFVYLEYGTALPRSGGEKVYVRPPPSPLLPYTPNHLPQLERVYRRPRYLATCIFAVQFVLFGRKRHAVHPAGSRVGRGGVRRHAEDRDHQRRDRGH